MIKFLVLIFALTACQTIEPCVKKCMAALNERDDCVDLCTEEDQ